MSIRVWSALSGALLILFSSQAAAHTRSTSYSFWELDGALATVTVRVSPLDLNRLGLHPDQTPNYAQAVSGTVVAAFSLSSTAGSCAPSAAALTQAGDGWLSLRWDWVCPLADLTRIESRVLHEGSSQHLHFARAQFADGRIEERLLTSARPQWPLRESAGVSAPARIYGFLALGFEHILSGWDHLAFVLALLLLARRVSELIWMITGFTLAHSLTLGLAVLGVVQPASDPVEALIALSILLVALEYVWLQQGRGRGLPGLATVVLLLIAIAGPEALPRAALAGMALFTASYFALQRRGDAPMAAVRMAVTFAFGLFHGFGFAGVMLEMELPVARLWPALLGFNLGVEVGQLLVVLLAWPLLRRVQARQPLAGIVLASAIAGLGTYWFVLRVF
jgi:hypothetical protein